MALFFKNCVLAKKPAKINRSQSYVSPKLVLIFLINLGGYNKNLSTLVFNKILAFFIFLFLCFFCKLFVVNC